MQIGRYELLAEVGRGGAGIVYRARSPSGEVVALKVCRKLDPATLARFEREVKIAAALGDGFVPVLDAGTHGETPYLVMPLLPGGTLRDRLLRGALPIDEAVRVVRAVAFAMGLAHERGVVHRDLKPENVLFTEERPLVADLGLAKEKDDPAASFAPTRTGTFLGTGGYAAPEQLEDSRRATPAADVFALGAILYECLAGLPAFGGESALEALNRTLSGTYEPLARARRDCPAWLVRVVERALAFHATDRFATGAALARALDAEGAGGATSRWGLGVAALAILAISGGAFAAIRPSRGGALPPDVAPPPSRAVVSRPVAPPDDEGEAARALARARELMGEGNAREALAEAERATGLTPRSAAAWVVLADARALALEDGVLAAYDRAIELDPGDAATWSSRAGVHLLAGDGPRAIVDATMSIVLAPDRPDGWTARAAARMNLGDSDGAFADADLALALNPRNASALNLRAQVALERGDPKSAAEDATRALELDESPTSFGLRARARILLSEPDGALEDANRALALDPDSILGLGVRARARALGGDRAGAIEDYDRLVALCPGIATFLLERGSVHAALGDRARAAADFRGAIAAAPDDEAAAEARRLLREMGEKP